MKKSFLRWAVTVFLMSLVVFSSAASAQVNGNADQVLKAYKTAHAKKDATAMMALVLFQNGGAAEKASWKSDFESEARMAVTPGIAPISSYAAMLTPEARKRIRPTIKLVAWLVVEYPAAPGNASQRSGLYPIGIENGKAFIVGP